MGNIVHISAEDFNRGARVVFFKSVYSRVTYHIKVVLSGDRFIWLQFLELPEAEACLERIRALVSDYASGKVGEHNTEIKISNLAVDGIFCTKPEN